MKRALQLIAFFDASLRGGGSRTKFLRKNESLQEFSEII
jgi:hypothetical protein